MRERITNIWINVFWKSPNHLWGLKVTVSIACLLIPAELIFHNSFIGTTLALGVVAMALGETDVHPIGRIKSAAIALLLFFVSSSLVTIFLFQPVWFAVVLALMSFSLILIGGIDSRLQGVTFGAMLIIVYTMLGADGSDLKWYYQPTLLTIGAFMYSIVSITLLYFRPYRLLKEQLARSFHFLAEYIDLKANLFPSNPQSQAIIRNQLAQKNIELAQQIEACKQDLYSFSEEGNRDELPTVDHYYRKWFLLQAMQERAISSHEQYDLLSNQVRNTEILDGFGKLMREIASAVQLYAESLLTDQPYKHPISLKWTISALQTMLEAEKEEQHYFTLSLLMKNLTGLEENLREEEKTIEQIDVTVFHTRKPERNNLKRLLNPAHPRFRFAVRLTLSWLLGYGVMLYLNFGKGSWILMTSLIVFQQTYSATRLRLFHRLFGTLLGVVAGVVLTQLLPTLAGHILLMLASMYLFFFWLKQNYTIAVVFITIFVLAAFNLISNQGSAVALPRIIDTIVGGALAFLSVRFIWPNWQYKQLPGLLLNAVTKNRRYFESIYDGAITEEAYLHNRRTAYNADNALTSAWKWMRLEPRNMRRSQDRAFNLTNQNHALLSYISAFGVHKSGAYLSEKELDFCHNVSDVLRLVSEILTHKADEGEIKAYFQRAISWDEQMEEMMSDPANRRVRLISNIAHVARELLIEAKGIIET
ncbi:FUSC family membrane protein [Proteiniphilum sp.]|uniref:FUSC family membrane protein n=1 Tax=Proteiniphilum sp. TaxID=1926877 RepID=UPI002B212431|nr:FUSC family membrane protein [Proteiniphilum sp.]MEA4918968.1 FUSC family membrane protein [Proteiniphilum sp.]